MNVGFYHVPISLLNMIFSLVQWTCFVKEMFTKYTLFAFSLSPAVALPAFLVEFFLLVGVPKTDGKHPRRDLLE